MKPSAPALALVLLLAACGPDASDRIDDPAAAEGAAAPSDAAENYAEAAPPPAPDLSPVTAPDALPEPPADPLDNEAAQPVAEAGDSLSGGPPGARTVSCRVRSGDWLLADGPCRFIPTGGGSFTLDSGPDAPLRDDIVAVSVAVVAPGRAEVRGLTDRGVNARWGSATRSSRDPACWVGSDFEVCAR